MEIPLNAKVECSDGVFGRSVSLLINPILDNVSQMVVQSDTAPNAEYIVPVEFITEMIAETIRLRCSKADLEKMEPFIISRTITEKVPDRYSGTSFGVVGLGAYYYLPYVTPDVTVYETVQDEMVPEGELNIYRGTRVEATDGDIGHVDEFVVNPGSGHITHMVMREGHFFGKKDVIIPLSAIARARDDTVYLNLDKHQVEALPTFPVHRRWAL